MPIPDIQTNPANDGMAVPDSTDWANVAAGLNGAGIISGCVVSALGAPAMFVQVTSGSIASLGVQYAVSAASLSLQPSSTTDRRDIVIASPTSPGVATLSVIAGTPCGTAGWTRSTFPGLPPVKPSIPGNGVLLAEAYVAAGVSSIVNAVIIPSSIIDQPVQSIQGLSGNLSFYSPNSSVTITTSGASVGFTAIGGSGGSVSSVFGRNGTVTAVVGDYSAFYDLNGKAAAASTAAITVAEAASLQLTGGTMSGSIAMGTNAITGVTQETNVVAAPSVVAGAVTVSAAANRQSKFTVSATTAITMSTTNLADGIIALVVILDGGTPETLSWINTENSSISAPLVSKGSTTLPAYVLFRANGTTTKWACIGSV